MTAPPAITVDFETAAIANRPNYPPMPVGVAIRWPGAAGRYYACGHPTGNNCTPDEAHAALSEAWASGLPLLFHHAKFDMAVAYEKLGMPRLPWGRVHDTMFLAYLADPHGHSMALKELAEDYLGVAPDEQDELHAWIWDHRRELEATYGGKVVKSKLGAWIARTPGDLCGRYAVGDVDRTHALFEHLWPIIQNNGMGPAYDRERQLLPILMENEEIGMRVDMPALSSEIEMYNDALEHAEEWLRRELHASGLSFDNDRDVAAVLLERGVVAPEDWTKTATGQLSMSKEALLPEMFRDPRIASALGYRNRLVTCLKMFMLPWYEQASQRGGFMSTNWNQTRGNEGGGTRTGRPSTSNPNFLNISKDFEGRTDGYLHPDFLAANFPKLPLVRKYVLPDEGDMFLHRDFNGQELRIFADTEQGELWQAYQDDPSIDVHAFVGDKIKELTGQELERTKIKVLNFQALYGGGAPAAQRQLHCSLAEAKQYKAYHDKALPGRKIVVDEIKKLVKRGLPIRTWGGRIYYCEPPKDGRSKDYKLINYRVQGGAADLTKQALIDWHNACGGGARFLVTVYDELNISAPIGDAARQMRILKECMEERRLSVTMLSDGKHGPSWGNLQKGDPS